MTMPAPTHPPERSLRIEEWTAEVCGRVTRGARLAGLYGTDQDGSCLLTAVLATEGGMEPISTLLRPAHDGGGIRYPSLTEQIPAAFWYERALHDLSGVVPEGHPRLDPLLLPRADDEPAPRPGAGIVQADGSTPTEHPGPVDVSGHGMFTLPLGPVRSGVMESIEFLIETPGEDIPHLNVRPHYKHRGIAKQFEGRRPRDAVLVAERVEGISSVAHALAFSHAIEALADLDVSSEARLMRVVLSELERIANHLDVTIRLADSAGLAVATARFGWHKENVQRVLSGLCQSRFGRGTIAPGGLARRLPAQTGCARRVEEIIAEVRSDIAALEASASFLDRLRGTGHLNHDRALEHGCLGPIGRASGVENDVRRQRPYDGYLDLPQVPPPLADAGDALARARVRWHEITSSADIMVAALHQLGEREVHQSAWDQGALEDGLGLGSAEAAQGEVLYAVEVRSGAIHRCFARSASFHNLVLFHDVFAGDIFTDFPFIEASFGLGYAGVAM
jgi:formate hydrogenlyase subunit 5